jgi:hypothetical protein
MNTRNLEEDFRNFDLELERLFTLRQKAVHGSLTAENLCGLRETYLAVRHEEEEIRLQRLCLEQELLRKEGALPSQKPKPEPNRALRRRLRILMIVLFAGAIGLWWWGSRNRAEGPKPGVDPVQDRAISE